MTRFWIISCMPWVSRVGRARRRCSAASGASGTGPPRSSQGSRMLAAATASWMARLMPTPPIGDMACAASPMQSRPGRYQRSSRSTATVSSFTSSQLRSSWTRSLEGGGERRHRVAERREPLGAQLVDAALANDEGALPVIAAVEHHHDAASPRSGRGFAGDRPDVATAGATARPSARRDRSPSSPACAPHRRMSPVGSRRRGRRES